MLLRPLLFLAFAGLLALPDWSTARPFRRFLAAPPVACPVVYNYAPAPVVYAPVTYPAPPVFAGACVSGPVYSEPVVIGPVVGCPPAAPTPKGPTVVPERMPEGKQSVGPPAEPRAEPKATGPSPVRPVSGEERTPAAPQPIPIPSVPSRPLGEPLPRATGVEFAPPKAATGESQKPPAKPLALPDFPPLGLEKPGELPKGPEPTKTDPAKVEPLKPEPVKPEPAKPVTSDKPKDPLPTFELPPLPPLAPAQPVSSEKPTEVKSSPLNADPVADIYPAAGTVTDPVAKRSIGFINKSERDVMLTVAGKLVALPRGQFLRLDLPATFTWQIRGEQEREVTVPDTAPGVSVVIRK